MRTFAKSTIRYSKSQRLGIFAFIVVLIGLQVYIYFLNHTPAKKTRNEVPKEIINAYSGQNSSKINQLKLGIIHSFNPNELSAEQWMEFGFTEKQAQTILKYKKSLGGSFVSKDQIKKCFVINDQKFKELEAFIDFGSVNSSNSSIRVIEEDVEPVRSTVVKGKIHYQKFNPNDYAVEDWVRIGFSNGQANSLLKYKQSLGGKFTSIEQIQDAYVVSEAKFKEMKAYLVLPKSKSEELDQSKIKVIDEIEEDSTQTYVR